MLRGEGVGSGGQKDKSQRFAKLQAHMQRGVRKETFFSKEN